MEIKMRGNMFTEIEGANLFANLISIAAACYLFNEGLSRVRTHNKNVLILLDAMRNIFRHTSYWVVAFLIVDFIIGILH